MCPKGSVKIGRGLALRLLDWHAGQEDPVYTIGATALDHGACFPVELVADAAYNLRLAVKQENTPNSWGRYNNTKRVRDQIARLADVMTEKAKGSRA